MGAEDAVRGRERRSSVRTDARLRASYRLLGARRSEDSMTCDISSVGIGLLTRIPFAPGVVLQVDLEVPGQHVRKAGLIVQVVWSEPLLIPDHILEPRLYETGGRLLDIGPEEQAVLMQYCATSDHE